MRSAATSATGEHCDRPESATVAAKGQHTFTLNDLLMQTARATRNGAQAKVRFQVRVRR